MECTSVSSCPVRVLCPALCQVRGPRCIHPPSSQGRSLRLLELFSHTAHLLPFHHLPFFSFCFEIRSTLEIIYDGDFGTKNLTKVKVDKLIIHPYFDSWILDNDIALLLLKSPFNLNVTKVPICLSAVTDLWRWRNCWVSGWGITSELLCPTQWGVAPWLMFAMGSKMLEVLLALGSLPGGFGDFKFSFKVP